MAKEKKNRKDEDYQDWLKNANLEDTKENYDWFNTPIDKCSEYIENHKKWWEDL